MTIFERIKNRRLELNMSQEELALKTGYKTKGSISRIENGNRDINQSQIELFAKALDVSPEYLLLGTKNITKELKSVEDLDFSGINRIAAHFEGDEFSEDDLNEIQNFINYVKQKNKNKEK